MKVYGNHDCGSCIFAKEELERLGIDYDYLDLADIANLKEFLAYRDNLDIYDIVKELGKAGVPTFVLDNDEVTLNIEDVKKFYNK